MDLERISLSVILKINLFFLKFDKLTNTVLVQLLILTSSFCLYLRVRLMKFVQMYKGHKFYKKSFSRHLLVICILNT